MVEYSIQGSGFKTGKGISIRRPLRSRSHRQVRAGRKSSPEDCSSSIHSFNPGRSDPQPAPVAHGGHPPRTGLNSLGRRPGSLPVPGSSGRRRQPVRLESGGRSRPLCLGHRLGWRSGASGGKGQHRHHHLRRPQPDLARSLDHPVRGTNNHLSVAEL